MYLMKKSVDFILIIIVFALTGSTTAYLSGIIMKLLGAEPWTFGFVAGYLIFIFPLYQGLTLVYAAIFGKFNWFYSRQKKIAKKVAGVFYRKSKPDLPVSDTE